MTIGVIDNGIDTNNAEFAGRISAQSKDFGTDYAKDASGTYRSVATARPLLGPDSNHGTQAAGIIAAADNGAGIVGVAPGAKIAALRTDDYYRDENRQNTASGNVAAALTYAANQRFPIVNLSQSITGAATDIQMALTAYGSTGGLLVLGAGNTGASEPTSTTIVTDGTRGNVIFVGGLDASSLQEYRLHPNSNKAGSWADRYLVTSYQATSISAGTGTQTYAVTGTSFSAPMVAGAAALLLEKWPQLTGKQAGQILLDTAKDIGAPGTDAVFGRGLLDLEAALQPVNPTLTGQSASAVAQSFAILPAALDTTPVVKALGDVTVLDQYGRDFRVDLSNRVIGAKRMGVDVLRQAALIQNTRSASFVDQHMAGSVAYRFNRNVPADMPQAELASGYVVGSSGKTRWAIGFNQNLSGDTGSMGLAPSSDAFAAYAPQANRTASASVPFGRGRLGFVSAAGASRGTSAVAGGLEYSQGSTTVRLGMVQEHGSFLGAPSQGAFRLGDANSAVLDLSHSFAMGLWSLDAYGSLGLTELGRGESSIFSGGRFVSSRFGVSFGGPISATERVSIGLAQPLTIEGGSIRLNVGSGYDLKSRSLVMTTRYASARSAERAMMLTGGYAKAWGRNSLGFAVGYDTALAEASALFSLKGTF